MLLKPSVFVCATVALAATTDTFDYIIVGGGTTGLALATRPSQGLSKSKILVLEAGPAVPDELRINVPGMRGSTLGSEYDWNFTTIPQLNLQNRAIDVNRGKVLGGSSAINFLCYDRAAEAEYDAWSALGNEGWNWDAMIKAMLKTENFTGDSTDKHGNSGPIHSTYNRVIPTVLETWKPTMKKLGIPMNEASLGGTPIGAMYQPSNIDQTHWNRSYSANSYLPLAGSNLEVRAGLRVTRVDFAKQEEEGPMRAIGVTLEHGTKITASQEVILSAGTVQSPGLLELSGIGQIDVIKAAGITPLLELHGVGENLQDHVRTSNSYRLKHNVTTVDPLIYESTGNFSVGQLQLWLQGKPSLLDYTSVAYGFLNWGQVTGNDSELVRLANKWVGNGGSVVDQKKLDFLGDSSVPQLEIIMEPNYVGAKGYPGSGKFFTLISAVMHPMSRGKVHINPASPLGKPIIDANYLSNSYDLQAIIAGAKYVRKIAQTEPMASSWVSEYEPGPEVETDAQWTEFARNAMLSFYHPVGTCAMLPKKDGGVVDASLTVYGTSNLRVVDVSIVPVLISAHIQTSAYAIAEIAAEKIIHAASK